MSSTSANTQVTLPTLYIPLHKRSRSTTPSGERESSSDLPIYSIQDLLYLSKSPLVGFTPEQREHFNETVPQITLNRKQRKAIEHQRIVKNSHALVPAEETPSGPKASETTRKPLSPVWNTMSSQRRSIRQGRAPDRRRNVKVVDELSWRAPRTRSISATGSPLLLLSPTVA